MSGYPSNNWEDHHSAVRRHWNRRKEFVLRDLEEGDPGSVYEGYYEWFMVNTIRLISNPGNYEPQGYETSSSRVKLYGEVLNNIRVSTERFREKREDDNLLDEELDKHLDDIINQTHACFNLGANDEMEVDDTQIWLMKIHFSLTTSAGKKRNRGQEIRLEEEEREGHNPLDIATTNEGQQNEDQAHSSRGSRIHVETHFEEVVDPRLGLTLVDPRLGLTLVDSRLGLVDDRNHNRSQIYHHGESQSQPQIEARFGGQSQPHQSSILTYLKRRRGSDGPKQIHSGCAQ
ncbi:OLC1v1015338C1 [Oldenlandia corymbosa var. corymbosa]|uniref:OLC1v1015338C1 n=1 Tax=Oldenlandia corymbosa var. corymbosa TaxID=529605 RepID=A0AAV1E6G0_OLDCO|nr:OLC1v1015338C1 [Oldenlandia corymbosa var. corymbosa]